MLLAQSDSGDEEGLPVPSPPQTNSQPLPLSVRWQRTVKHVHNRMFAGMSRRTIILLVCLDLAFMAGKVLCEKLGRPGMARVFTLLFIQLAMLMVSTFMFKRVAALVPRTKTDFVSSSARTSLKVFIGVWVFLSHICWVFFYIPLPADFFFAILCFLGIGSYIHCAVFLFTFFFIERISQLALPRVDSVLLKSERLHTIVAVVLALILSAHGFMVTSQRPLTKTFNIPIRDLPPQFDGFSIALITDIHIGPSVGKSRVAEIVQVVNQIQPDVVTISGDLVDGFVDYLAPRIKPLADLRSKYGAFVATGNHEFMHDSIDNWIHHFKSELNMTTLVNSAVVLDKNGAKLCLAGVDDFYTESLRVPGHRMDAARALAQCPENTPTVMMVHQPNGASQILNRMKPGDKRIDLILAGHTHASQMFPIYPLSFLSNKYFFGLYTHPATGAQIYVSSGVNYWGPPIKMPNLCEVVNLRLHRAE